MGKKFFQILSESESEKPLTLTCIDSGGGTVQLKLTGSGPDISGVQYRLGDSGSWTAYTKAVSVGYMECVQFQNTNSTLSMRVDGYVSFSLSGLFESSGNVQSMLNYSNEVPECGLYSLFRECTSLVTAPELSATTLYTHCYDCMFYGCTALVTAPELPATTLANGCYANMFRDCTSLTSAPELPATALATQCYFCMFYGCTKLNYIKVGFTAWLSHGANSWVFNVSSTGTFYKPSALPEEYGVDRIPEGWTVVNID